ncbi:MAG: T9SS type A sorting domain-containing protein [candidate division WOR-3 bacterium]
MLFVALISQFRGMWYINKAGAIILWEHRNGFYLYVTGFMYEWQGNRWILLDSINMRLLGAYDTDRDGRLELFFYKKVNGPDTFYIFEEDSFGNFSFDRDKAVYRDIASGSNVMMPGPPYCYFGDADRDGLRDIFCISYAHDSSVVGCELCPWFVMFESCGNNCWEKKPLFPSPIYFVSRAMMDTDGDGKLEFGYGRHYSPYTYGIIEIVGNDSADVVKEWYAPTVFYSTMLDDVDNDGKPEIMFHGQMGFGYYMQDFVKIYEAVSDNEWKLITNTFSTMRGGMVDAIDFSTYGDIDNDGKIEILLNTFNSVVIIKSVGDNTFEVVDTLRVPGDMKVFPYQPNGIFDIDRDGEKEIVISNWDVWWTMGYEYRSLGVDEGVSGDSRLEAGDGYVMVEGRGVLRIYDLAGRLRKEEVVKGRQRVYLNDLPKGVYFIRFKNKTLKFIRR